MKEMNITLIVVGPSSLYRATVNKTKWTECQTFMVMQLHLPITCHVVGMVSKCIIIVTDQEGNEECKSREKVPDVMIVVESHQGTGTVQMTTLCWSQLG